MKHIVITPDLIKKIKPFWEQAKIVREEYYLRLARLEADMAESTGIKDIEFFHCNDEIAGIGNSSRTMPLIHTDRLDKGD
jgi:hypothetical protein